MIASPKPILVDDETTLSAMLAAAAANPVRLEHNGVVYRLVREDADLWAGYDPERVRAGLRRFAGSIAAEDAERMKAAVYRALAEGSRPSSRP